MQKHVGLSNKMLFGSVIVLRCSIFEEKKNLRNSSAYL